MAQVTSLKLHLFQTKMMLATGRSLFFQGTMSRHVKATQGWENLHWASFEGLLDWPLLQFEYQSFLLRVSKFNDFQSHSHRPSPSFTRLATWLVRCCTSWKHSNWKVVEKNGKTPENMILNHQYSSHQNIIHSKFTGWVSKTINSNQPMESYCWCFKNPTKRTS